MKRLWPRMAFGFWSCPIGKNNWLPDEAVSGRTHTFPWTCCIAGCNRSIGKANGSRSRYSAEKTGLKFVTEVSAAILLPNGQILPEIGK